MIMSKTIKMLIVIALTVIVGLSYYFFAQYTQIDNSISNVRVISPNGNEVYKFGETHTIRWEAPRNVVKKATNLIVSVERYDDELGKYMGYSPRRGKLPVTLTKIDWQIQASRSAGPMLPSFENLMSGGQYRVHVRYEYDYCSIVGHIPGCAYQSGTLAEDVSDSYFTISSR